MMKRRLRGDDWFFDRFGMNWQSLPARRALTTTYSIAPQKSEKPAD